MSCEKKSKSCQKDECVQIAEKRDYEGRINLSLDALKKYVKNKGAGKGEVYYYIVSTAKNENGQLVQRGTAPNFQGGVITLCTCKHRMRTEKDNITKWEGTWIAGFASKKGTDKQYLLYMMRVEKAYANFSDMWNNLPKEVRRAKDNSKHASGDLYQPISEDIKDKLSVESYKRLAENNPHNNKGHMRDDVCYEKGIKDRKPALLLGENDLCFVWSKPMLYLEKVAYTGRKVHHEGILDFLSESVKQKGVNK